VGEPALTYYHWPPKIQVTDSLFEATIEEKGDLDGEGKKARWHLRQDSKLWRTVEPSSR